MVKYITALGAKLVALPWNAARVATKAKFRSNFELGAQSMLCQVGKQPTQQTTGPGSKTAPIADYI